MARPLRGDKKPRPEGRKKMDQEMITDITLDHLPDLSEASVSFQIPTNNASADLLLADHTDGFDLLYNAVDDDASFAPVALRHLRGPPLTLGELTPRAKVTSRTTSRSRSPTPTPVASSSAKPFVIQRPPTLGHCSPDKPRKPPSRAKSIQRQLESPMVSEERLDQLRAEVETLAQADETESHVEIHVVEPAEESPAECKSPSRATLKLRNNALDSPPPSKHRLDPLPEEKDTRQDIVMATGDDCPTEATTIRVPRPRPKSKRNPRTSAKPTVAAGGISKRPAFPTTHVSKKTKSKPSPSCVREAHQMPPSAACQITPPQSIAIDTEEELAPPACISGDIDFKSENTQITRLSTGGVAQRLVSYSQNLISSIGLSKPWPGNSSTEASNNGVRLANAQVEARLPATALQPSSPPQRIDDIPSGRSVPFRLSEISPHKPPPNAPQPSSATDAPQDNRQHDMSPMRPAKKRVSMDADLPQEYHRRKKGRGMPANADSERRSSDEAVSQAPPLPDKKAGHEDQRVMCAETCENTWQPESSQSTLPTARTKYRPKLNSSSGCKGPTLDAFPYLSISRQVHRTIDKDKGKRDKGQCKAANAGSESSLSRFSANSRLRQDKQRRQRDAWEYAHKRQRSGPISTADLPLIEKQNATLSVARLTKPVGFTFRVEARLEARKAEGRLAVSEPGKTHLLPVPDTKALRASHEAKMVFHREGVVPSVPVVPFFFCTEQRAKEREKFDEMMRRKEEEIQRLQEEQQRREAEEEERAIKALRRKAIPKANEIPEWYAGMPKRKGMGVRN